MHIVHMLTVTKKITQMSHTCEKRDNWVFNTSINCTSFNTSINKSNFSIQAFWQQKTVQQVFSVLVPIYKFWQQVFCSFINDPLDNHLSMSFPLISINHHLSFHASYPYHIYIFIQFFTSPIWAVKYTPSVHNRMS
jgi:hypothetical protein